MPFSLALVKVKIRRAGRGKKRFQGDKGVWIEIKGAKKKRFERAIRLILKWNAKEDGRGLYVGGLTLASIRLS